MIRSRWHVAVLAIAVTAAGTTTQAGLLPTDPHALPGWQGTQLYSLTIASLKLIANVEFAVYKPGDFGTSFGAANDPSGGADYVYAYQIFNDQGGNRSVGNLTVGFNGHNELPANIGHLTGFGQAPDDSYFVPAAPPPTSGKWDFLSGNVLAVDAHSEILLYTSPFPPERDTATLQGGSALGQTQYLPSPVPEPATALLALSLGASVALVARRRRRPG